MITIRLALVIAVYIRFLFRSFGGPLKRGMITTGYSLPWDLCIVTANACSSSDNPLNG